MDSWLEGMMKPKVCSTPYKKSEHCRCSNGNRITNNNNKSSHNSLFIHSNGLNIDGVLADPSYRDELVPLFNELLKTMFELPCPTFACISGTKIEFIMMMMLSLLLLLLLLLLV